MKPIKSTMKEKKRYFLIKFKTNFKTNLDFKTKKNIILYYYKKLFGTVGLAKARLLFFNTKENTKNNIEKNNSADNNVDNTIIVRVNLKEQNNLRLTLLNIKEFEIKNNEKKTDKKNEKNNTDNKTNKEKIKLTAYTIKTSGILKKLKETKE